MFQWLKLRVKQKEQPEDTCCNEVNMGRCVLCLSWPDDHLLDTRRGLRRVRTLHTCTLAHLPPYLTCNCKNDCDMGCSWNVTNTRAVCPLWSATTHASLQFIGCLSASQRNEEHVTGKMLATRLARRCEPRLQASAYLCFCFVWAETLMLNPFKQQFPHFSSMTLPLS